MDERGGPTGHTARALTLAELLDDEVMRGAELIAGRSGIDRPISAVNVMTVPDIGRWVRRNEFLLVTGYPLPRDVDGQIRLLRDLHEQGLAGVGVKLDRYVSELGSSVVDGAERLQLPLVVIPEDVRFDDILSTAYGAIVNRQAWALERAQEIHRSFLQITLLGGGLMELARKLSGLLDDAAVVIANQQGTVLALTGDEAGLSDPRLLDGDMLRISSLGEAGSPTGEPTGRRWVSREIRAGRLHHGFVVAVEGARPFGEFSTVVVEQAATVAALEVTRDLAIGAVERRFSSNALFELIHGGDAESGDSATLSAGFGWDLERRIVVLVAYREGGVDESRYRAGQARLAEERIIDLWTTAVRGKDRAAAAGALGAELVAVIGADQEARELASSVLSEIGTWAGTEYAVGISRIHPGPAEISAAYHEARAAVRLRHRVSGSGAVTSYDELGLLTLLAQAGDDELNLFAQETLGPVMALPDPERSDMLDTLERLIAHNMNVAETARHLHYHYNTLRYRLAKLERLIGPLSTSTPVAIKVGVALQILEMQRNLAGRRG